MNMDRGISLKLCSSEWLTLDVVCEGLVQIDDERTFNYNTDFVLSVILHIFITKIKAMNNEELDELMEYYAKEYRNAPQRKPNRIIRLPEKQYHWLNTRCNKLNDTIECDVPYYTLGIFITAAIYDFRNENLRLESEELGKEIDEHVLGPRGSIARQLRYVKFYVFRRDQELLEFATRCAAYFSQCSEVRVQDVLSLSLKKWLNRFAKKDNKQIYFNLEETGSRLLRFRGYRIFGRNLYDFDKVKKGFFIRYDVYFGINNILAKIEELDEYVVPIGFSVIATDAIRELKKDFLLDGMVNTLEILQKKGFSPFR